MKSDKFVRVILGSAALVFTISGNAAQCPGVTKKVTGTVYCDNKFTLWVDGKKVAVDPLDFTPHQAVAVAFEWDGVSSITYAIQCEDYASESGYEYTGSSRPQLGDGALIAQFDDGLGTATSANWKVYTSTFGPTGASLAEGCSPKMLDRCRVADRGIPEGWTNPKYDDGHWKSATVYSAEKAGWGRPPTWSSDKGCCTLTSPIDHSALGCDQSISKNECLIPKEEFAETSADFIWAEDLERDNRVLFRTVAICN